MMLCGDKPNDLPCWPACTQGALNPTNALLVSYDDLVRSVNRYSHGLVWETSRGKRKAPLDALALLADYMTSRKVSGHKWSLCDIALVCVLHGPCFINT